MLTRIFHRDLVDDVLRETGKAGQRIRRLPGRVVVYLVLAMCLFFDDAYEEVIRKLVNGLGFLGNWSDTWQVPTSSAVSKARHRLGAAALAELFDRVAVPQAGPGTAGSWYAGLRVMAVDGAVLDVPDTEANRTGFAKPGPAAQPGPFPQVRLVGLGECGTHAITGAAFDSCAVSERVLLARLIEREFEAGMLALADRGFYSYALWTQALATGAHLLWRIKDDLHLPVLQVLPDGSQRSELVPRQIKNSYRRGHRREVPAEVRVPVRVIEYTVPNRDGTPDRIRLLTSLTDHQTAPAAELAALYQQRWEFELTLDEAKVHQMPGPRRLRSHTPELVRQEIWALLLVHYAVREFMTEAADDIGEDPDRLSFIRTIRVIRRQVTNQAGFSPLPTQERDTQDH